VLVHAYEQAGVDHDLAVAAAAHVPEAYVDPSYWTVFDDTRPVLARMREAGWRHVVLSNHVPELPNLVHDLGLDDLIEDVITSATTGYEKPHPQMFTDAIRRAGSPGQVWMIGDSPTADIAGAERAGIPALLVRTSRAPGIAGRDLYWAADLIVAGTTRGESAGPAG
jgi:putative hydrolase of the HAD superfamily